MALPTNILQQVQTYQRSGLALLQNYCGAIATANTKFKDFNKIEANLGSSVTFDEPPRALTVQGLVASPQPSVQLVQTLTVDQSLNSALDFTSQQRIFNVEKPDADSYVRVFGRSIIAEIGSTIEHSILKNANSSVISEVSGSANTASGPFRMYGDGSTAINSYQQLAQIIANFKDFGMPHNDIKVFLPSVHVPAIVGTGLGEFATNRNNDIAQSWDVGTFGAPPVRYIQSNLLPRHTAGTVGSAGTVLTLVSTNDATGNNVTQLTFSGAGASDADAVKAGDIFTFSDGVSGQPNQRFLTYIGHAPSAQKVQFRATADAASTAGGQVTINIEPGLKWVSNNNAAIQITNALAAGMKVTSIGDHICGLVVGGDSMFLAMPKLPGQEPFPTANEYDEDTGVSIRLTYGALIGQNQNLFVHDAVWGSFLHPVYSMRIAFPLA